MRLATIAVLLELFYHLLEIALTRRRVDRRGLQPLVAQQGGHAYEISSCIEGVLPEAVAQGLRRDVLTAGQPSILRDQQLDGPGADPLSTLTDEQLIRRDRG